MRKLFVRTALCLTLIALTANTASAGVRGKPTKLKEPIGSSQRLAQGDPGYGGVNSHPVPLPTGEIVTNERVIQESTVPLAPAGSDPGYACATPSASPNTVYVAVPMPMPQQLPMPAMGPMLAPPPMPLMPGPGCANCGGYGYGGYGYGGLNPMAAAAYYQSFGPGLYRTGAEAGQFHFPYYSYRRPWYFPGQPSFQRSTDYVW